MKTLVIHPFDPSTEFLREIYANINATVMRMLPLEHSELRVLMRSHDRIIGLGHGSPYGLFNVSNHRYSYAIGVDDFDLLTGKDNIYIWCNADQYVRRGNLKGFSSGMFISEVSEARMFGFKAPKTQIEVSNYAFAVTLGRNLENGSGAQQAGKKTLLEYFDPSDAIINFNNKAMIIL